jgi:succinoglycan biosynthesis protein ExoM
MNTPEVRVAICIPTFKRLGHLRALLAGISALKFIKTPQPQIQVIAVDNDPAGSAEATCATASMPWHLEYFIEPQRGLSPTRNRAIAEAGDVDYLAFIDDDEIPQPQWLDELLYAQQILAADVVAGPVLPSFTADVPAWIVHSPLFYRKTHASGECMPFCASGNVLIRRAVLDCVPNFDLRFALTGGEDGHFFFKVTQAGFKIVWCAEAIAYETISSRRANIRWLLRRAYMGGNNWAIIEADFDNRWRVKLIRALKASMRIAQGAVSIPFSLFSGRAALTSALSKVSLGSGMLSGLAGFRYLAYQSNDCTTDCTPNSAVGRGRARGLILSKPERAGQ